MRCSSEENCTRQENAATIALARSLRLCHTSTDHDPCINTSSTNIDRARKHHIIVAGTRTFSVKVRISVIAEHEQFKTKECLPIFSLGSHSGLPLKERPRWRCLLSKQDYTWRSKPAAQTKQHRGFWTQTLPIRPPCKCPSIGSWLIPIIFSTRKLALVTMFYLELGGPRARIEAGMATGRERSSDSGLRSVMLAANQQKRRRRAGKEEFMWSGYKKCPEWRRQWTGARPSPSYGRPMDRSVSTHGRNAHMRFYKCCR